MTICGRPATVGRVCIDGSVGHDGDPYPAVIGSSHLESVPRFHGSVERGSLFQGPTQWLHQDIEVALGDLLTVLGAGGPGDVLVHKGATQVVDASLQ